LEIKHCTDLARVNCKEIRPYTALARVNCKEINTCIALGIVTLNLFYNTYNKVFYENKTRQKQLLRMEIAYFSVLTEQHSPSSFCHLKSRTQCHLDFLEMKLRVGLTQHTYPTLGTYVFQGETRYDDIILMLFYYLDNIRMFINAAFKHLRFRFVCIFS
jgi:hypothetical protein